MEKKMANVNLRDVNKLQILFDAAKTGDEEAIKSLLEKKEVDITRKVDRKTALHIAVFNGHKNVVRLLCKIKPLLYIPDEKRRTPLHIAVYKNHLQIVEILCQNGSPIDDKDKERNTPLFIAVSQNHLEIVQCLVNHGVLLIRNDRHSKNIFHVALQEDYKSIVQILLREKNLIDICSCPSYPDPEFAEEVFNQCLEMQTSTISINRHRKYYLKNALYHAVSNGRVHQVKKLVESGVSVKYDISGMTPLDQAVKKRDVIMVEYLLTIADVNNSGIKCFSMPLHYASKTISRTPDSQPTDFEDSLEIMKILLKNGASVDLFDERDRTPLHYAAEEKEFQPEKIRLLLEYKADINAQLGERPTPLFFVNCEAILQMLIDKGANLNYRSPHFFFETPLFFAHSNNDLALVDILLENGADVDGCIVENLFKNDEEINEAIIDRIKDITSAMNRLVKDRQDIINIIPILTKRHFQGEVTIHSEEFSSASGIFFPRFKECQEELERMRDVHILNFCLLDALVLPIKKLRNYVMNEEVFKVFHCGTIQEEFPVYFDMIMRRFKRAKEEKNLIDSSCMAFEKLIFRLQKIHLPDLVVYKIIDFLHKVDRRKLVQL